MMLGKRAIKVHTMPERSAAAADTSFNALMQEYSGVQRPRIVLDCSNVWEMDIPMIRLLLSYLEEVMRHNGDVRLASLNPAVESELHRAGVSRLFEIYPTTETAIESFHTRTSSVAPLSHDPQIGDTEAEFAA